MTALHEPLVPPMNSTNERESFSERLQQALCRVVAGDHHARRDRCYHRRERVHPLHGRRPFGQVSDLADEATLLCERVLRRQQRDLEPGFRETLGNTRGSEPAWRSRKQQYGGGHDGAVRGNERFAIRRGAGPVQLR